MNLAFTPAKTLILLIEDDPADSILIKEQLHALSPHAEVEAAKSLKEGLIAYHNRKPDLILLDLNLPDGMGPRSVLEIRRYCKTTPIIVLTGIAPDVTKEEAKKNGANAVLQKTALTKDERFKQILSQFISTVDDVEKE